jgi:formylglycine-generating enzyme required for sulfatase activity
MRKAVADGSKQFSLGGSRKQATIPTAAMLVRLAVATIAFSFTLFVGGALANKPLQKRTALLISNFSYQGLGLNSPKKDGQILANQLLKQGFRISHVENVDKLSMKRVIQDFVEKVNRHDLAFFYFSGLGLTSLGRSYLLPVDARIESEEDIWRHGLSVERILRWLSERSPIATIAVIDAAREYQPEKSFRERPAGLAPDIGTINTLTIYSASPGQIFPVNRADESLFGKELAAQVGKPEIFATEAFNLVRLRVARKSGGKQVPLVTSSIPEKLSLTGAPGYDVKVRLNREAPQNEPSTGATESSSPAEKSPDSLQTKPFGQQRRRERNGNKARRSSVVRDCSLCPELVIVLPGKFLMGTSIPYQGPPHSVRIRKGFAVGKYEISFAEWEACVKDNGCARLQKAVPQNQRSYPIYNVSWGNAKQYADWLSKKTGRAYRLPTEAEWEYMARAGTKTPFWWGRNVGLNNANCVECNDEQYGKPRPVGSFPANPFGIHDTAGNVAEWVEDCWNSSYRGAPKDGSAWLSGNCSLRVLRGGSFDNRAGQVQSAYRFRYDAYVPYSANGFRVVRELE